METIYVGMDVHKDTIAVAVADAREVRDQGTISGDLHAVEKLVARLRKAHAGAKLRFCYEAGPCGFVIARRLTQLGEECLVVSPSQVARPAGDRVKTDRRDARLLARLLRAGELKAVYVPEPVDEAIRDLCRGRSDAVDDLRRSRARLKGFLLRNGYRYSGKANWSAAHQRYLRELVFADPAQKRVERSEATMRRLLADWPLRPAVEALMAMRGFQRVAAMTMVSELGDIHRFAHPRALMNYLGLVCSESSSSSKRRQGSITKAGNPVVRWMLVECAQHYLLPPKVSKELSARQEGASREVKQLSWKAQTRLHERYRALLGRRMMKSKVVVAVARELSGFVWAMLRTQRCYQAAADGPGRVVSRGWNNSAPGGAGVAPTPTARRTRRGTAARGEGGGAAPAGTTLQGGVAMG